MSQMLVFSHKSTDNRKHCLEKNTSQQELIADRHSPNDLSHPLAMVNIDRVSFTEVQCDEWNFCSVEKVHFGSWWCQSVSPEWVGHWRWSQHLVCGLQSWPGNVHGHWGHPSLCLHSGHTGHQVVHLHDQPRNRLPHSPLSHLCWHCCWKKVDQPHNTTKHISSSLLILMGNAGEYG